MGDSGIDRPAKFVAVITHVREVSLLGTADLRFWQDRLRSEKLCPIECDGKAQILISAVDARFKGLRFQELSVSIAAGPVDGSAERAGYYLARAFNSRRLFAWVERRMFSTPYYHARVEVDCGLPASIDVAEGNRILLSARMTSDGAGRVPLRSGDECWEGPIFLPRSQRRADGQGKWFFATIGGHTQTYAFAGSDALTLNPHGRHEIFQWLIDSDFKAGKWIIRENATHARSKTFDTNKFAHRTR